MKYSIILDSAIFGELRPQLAGHYSYHGRRDTMVLLSVDEHGRDLIEQRLPGQIHWPTRASITVPQVKRVSERMSQ